MLPVLKIVKTHPSLFNSSTLIAMIVLTMTISQSFAVGTNSLVRFRFFHGSTFVGDVVVELYAQERPATVQNFLRYLYDGAYDNLMLHRCEPNWVIQSGFVRSLNPLSTASVSGNLISATVSHEPITNEFSLVPHLSNVFGTLAMAKVAGDPDSATTDWFFNLSDNSATNDTENGGYTVFGRAVSGTNILAFFNHTNRLLGISSYFDPPFNNLPVAFNPTAWRLPRFFDLYHVQVTLLDGSKDSIRRTLRINSPGSGARLTNGQVTVVGTASDNAGVRMVWYSLNGGWETNALGTTNWSAPVALAAGTNTFQAQSVDLGGRRSPAVLRRFFWSVPQTISVNRVGPGTIAGPTNGQVLEIGKIYSITANPAARHKFLKWDVSTADGGFSDSTRSVRFFMRSNMSWTANFVTNPFYAWAGQYVGAAFHTNNIIYDFNHWRLADSFCSFTLTLTDQGAFSGKLRQGTGNYPFTGTFRLDGTAAISVSRTGLAPLTLTLAITNSQITGGVDAYPTWYSYLQGERVSIGTTVRPSRWAGRYTASLPGGTNFTSAPPGNGPGALTVSSAGSLSLVGTLSDGTPVTYSTPVSTNGFWPLYVPLYGGKGALFAWSQFNTNSPSQSLSGLCVWTKRATTATKLYTNGFVVTNILAGSAYRAPSGVTNRLLNFTNGVLAFTDGGLVPSISNEIALSASGVVTNRSSNKLTFTLTRTSGLFTGTVTPPGSTKAVSFKGVVLQNQNSGTGYFLNTNAVGGVFLSPRW